MKKFILRFLKAFKNADIFDEKVFSVLLTGVGACALIIAVSQFGLRNTSTRRFFTKIDLYEGAYFEASAIAESKEAGKLTLTATGDDFTDARILVNGETYSDLKSGENEIEISGWSVVEIYAPKGKINVEMKNASEGVEVLTAEKSITADGQIKLLGRFNRSERK